MITCNNLRLIINHFLCGAGLPFLQLLPDAGDDAQVALQTVSHLRHQKGKPRVHKKLRKMHFECQKHNNEAFRLHIHKLKSS